MIVYSALNSIGHLYLTFVVKVPARRRNWQCSYAVRFGASPTPEACTSNLSTSVIAGSV